MAVPESRTPHPSRARGTTTRDAAGPVVALCVGHRCAALRALAGTRDSVEELAASVRVTRGAVLVTADCLGACAHSAVAGVGHRDAGSGRCGRTLWLSGVHEPARAGGLAEWVAAGGPAPDDVLGSGMPEALADAVLGIGPPVRLGVPAGT